MKFMKLISIIAILFVGLSQFAHAQCSGCYFGGSSSACTNSSPSYFVSGGNCGSGSISSVSGDATSRTWTPGTSTITWKMTGTYTINFSCSCGTISQDVTVTSSPSINSTITPSNQTLCTGQTPSSISVAYSDYSGPISGWQKKLIADASWTDIPGTGGTNTLTSSYISNTQTYQYRMVLYQCSTYAYSTIATVNITPLASAPPTPTTGDISSNCGVYPAIMISTNYAAGATIRHYYYSSNGGLLSVQNTTNPTSTVYVSSYSPTTAGTQFKLQAEVVDGCGNVQSGIETINYTVTPAPTAPSGLMFLLNSSPVSNGSINVCSGEIINLVASGGSTNYHWYDPRGVDIGSSNSLSNFSPTASGQYNVTSTWNNPCGGSSPVNGNIQITVSNPTAQISNPGLSFCSSLLPTYSVSLSDGASNVSYSWSVTGSSATSTSSSFQIPSNISAGLQTVSCNVTATFAGQCQATRSFRPSAAFQVNSPLPAPPTPTTGDISSNCGVYPAIMISTNYAAGATIRHYYYSSTGALLSVQNTTNPTSTVYVSSYTPSIGTQFKLQAEVVGGVCGNVQSGIATINYAVTSAPTAPSSLMFLLNSSPVSNGSINVCLGEIINLVASGGSTNYHWYDPRGVEIGSSNSLSNFSPTINGPYYVTSTWNNPCGGTSPVSGNIQINVSPPPDASINPNGAITICSSCAPKTVNGIQVSGYSYQWYNAGTAIQGASTSSYQAFQDGTYSLKVTTPAGCSSTSSSSLQLHVNIKPTVTVGADQVVVLPTRSAIVQGSASDADGSVVSYSWNETSGDDASLSGTSTNTLSLTNLAAGTYKFRLTVIDDFGEQVSSRDMIVQVNYPSNNYNYVMESTVQISGITNGAAISGLPVEQVNVHTNYIDGLGRPMQNVATQGSPSKADLVQPVIYDDFSRENKKYLPFTNGANGWYKVDPVGAVSGNYAASSQYNYYNTNGTSDKVADDTRPFAETIFEKSPLNRPSQQFGAGQNWKDNNKSINHQYLLNGANEVYLFVYDPVTGLVALPSGVTGYYGAGQLHANVTTDEHGNDVIEYADKLGHTVCKKVQYNKDGQGYKLYASTYYLYNDSGSLVMVLPPEAVRNFESSR